MQCRYAETLGFKVSFVIYSLPELDVRWNTLFDVNSPYIHTHTSRQQVSFICLSVCLFVRTPVRLSTKRRL